MATNNPRAVANNASAIPGATIDKLVNHVSKLYSEDEIPWIVGYSGGKDSSACLQLMWNVLEKLKLKYILLHCNIFKTYI